MAHALASSVRWEQSQDGGLLMPPLQSEFLDWLLSDIKDPTTQTEWAVLNDMNPRTVKSWKADPRFKQVWEQRAAEKNISPERIQDMVNTMYMAGKNGDVKAATAYIGYIEKFMPAPERQTNDQSIRALSDEDLAAALMEATGVTSASAGL